MLGSGVFTLQAMMPMVTALSPRAFVSLPDATGRDSTLAGLMDHPYTA